MGMSERSLKAFTNAIEIIPSVDGNGNIIKKTSLQRYNEYVTSLQLGNVERLAFYSIIVNGEELGNDANLNSKNKFNLLKQVYDICKSALTPKKQENLQSLVLNSYSVFIDFLNKPNFDFDGIDAVNEFVKLVNIQGINRGKIEGIYGNLQTLATAIFSHFSKMSDSEYLQRCQKIIKSSKVRARDVVDISSEYKSEFNPGSYGIIDPNDYHYGDGRAEERYALGARQRTKDLSRRKDVVRSALNGTTPKRR